MKKLFLGVAVVLFTAVTMSTQSSNGDLKINEALAGGICCPEPGSLCITFADGEMFILEDFYLRLDGKRCDADILVELEDVPK